MQQMHKLMIALLAVLGVQGSAFAYRYTFANHTNEQLKFRLNLAGDGQDWDFTMEPRGDEGQDHEEWFPWIHEKIVDWDHNRRAGFCWTSFKIRRQLKDPQSGEVLKDSKG